MLVVLPVLKIKITELDACDDLKIKIWRFANSLQKKDSNFFKQYVVQYSDISFLYSVFKTKLATDASKKSLKKLEADLMEALVLCELLMHIAEHYLKDFTEVKKFRAEQEIYQNLLAKFNFKFNINTPVINPLYIEKTIKSNTISINLPRFLLIRGRRLLWAFNDCLPHAINYYKYLLILEKILLPFIQYLAWVFFVPRLAINLWCLGKHVLPGIWMEEEEKNLGLQKRLQAQLTLRWFELVNDAIWMIGGLLICFSFTGILVIVGIYTSLLLQAYDLCINSIRFYRESNRLSNLISLYEKKENRDEDFLEHLCARVIFERQRIMLNVVNAAFIVVAAALTMPLFGFMPILQLVGALLLVATTLVTFIMSSYLEKQNPELSIQNDEEIFLEANHAEKFKFFSSGDVAQINKDCNIADDPLIVENSF